jgi:hypothetical protein
MNIIALTEERSWFFNNTDLPQLPLNDITPQILSQYAIAVICPEKDRNPKPVEIIEWKRAGYLPRTLLCFGSYKGIHYWNAEREKLVERWVVHSKSEIERCKSKRMTFISLSYKGIQGEGTGKYVFCGGLSNRDFKLAAQAVAATNFEARFVSNLLPPINHPNIHCTYRRIPLNEYKTMLAEAWITLVPVKPSLQSRGHSDVVRSLVAGRPVIVTRRASCDDYVIDGFNGYLVSYDVDEWKKALLRAWESRDTLTTGARTSALKYTSALYNTTLREMIQNILLHPKTL